ncbi:MAG: antitoxin [Acidimicrobiales bacterium]
MGILDKIKGLVGGNADKVEDAIDKAAEVVKDKVPDAHDDKIDMAAEKAKDLVDDLDGEEE